MWVYSVESLQIVDVNESALELYGYTKDKFLNLTLEDLRPAREIPKLREELKKKKDSFSDAGIWCHKKKNGEKIYVRILSSPIRSESEDKKLVVAQNLTEYHRAKDKLEKKTQSLKQQKLLLEAITEQSDSMIFVKDVDGPYKLVNEKFKEDFGFTGQKVIGKTDRELFEPKVAKQLIEADKEVLKSGVAKHIEETVPTVDGHKTYVSVKYPLLSIPGYENSICGIATDITDLKNAEKEIELLYEREKVKKDRLELINKRLTLLTKVNTVFLETEHFEKALKEISILFTKEVADLCSFDIIIDGNLKRVVTTHREQKKEEIAKNIHREHPNMFYGSDFLLQVLSEKQQVFIPEISDELLQEHISDLYLKDLVKKLEMESILIKSLHFKGKKVGVMTWVLSGEQKELVENAPLLIDELSNKLALAIDNMLINNKLKSLNETLEKKVLVRTQMLEKANKELEAFSYSVSHDLRAPLRAIDGYSSLLLEGYYDKLDEDGQHFLTTVNEEAKRMGELIDDLLAFSRMHRSDKRISTFSMTELVHEAIEEVAAGFDGIEADTTVHELPTITGDRNMLKQVWVNLINNSFKYRKKNSPPKVTIKAELDKNHSEFIFSITDEGVGFNMKYADKLFGVFQRLHSEEEFEGTGIGLALVRRVINRHNGRTWADSEIDKGTTIYLTIPTQDQEHL